MPTYVVLVNWTEQGVMNVQQTVGRTDHGGEMAEKHGLELKEAYWTVGATTWSPFSRRPTMRP